MMTRLKFFRGLHTWKIFNEKHSRQRDGVWCNPRKGRINSFIQLMSLSRWGASLARNWRGCFNGIVVIHGVCGRVASARISCFRASCGLAKHRYWLNYMLHPFGSKDPTRRWQRDEWQGMLLPSVWNAFCGQPGLKILETQGNNSETTQERNTGTLQHISKKKIGWVERTVWWDRLTFGHW